jgi:predicted MPP superfamily phosphohydrolase
MYMEMSLLLYLVGNVYLLRRAWKALAGTGVWRQVILVAYLVFSYSYFLMHRLERGEPSRLKEAVCACGSIYIGLLLYFVLFTAIADLVRIADRRLAFLPESWRSDKRKAGHRAFGIVVGATFLLLLGGTIYARHVRVHTLDITIEKAGGPLKSLNVVALADIHVGPFMRVSRLEGIIRRVNALDPDVVLLLGDFMNEETIRPERERLPAALAGIRARYGVFACLGQHEYFVGLNETLAIFEAGHVRVLADEAVLVGDSFYLVGRGGRGYFSSSRRRPPLGQVLKDADMVRPVILMDHTPLGLNEAADAGVDLQLSGHTHAGQAFPATLVNGFLYEIGNGYGRKGKTQYYVSAGVGVWSPPARIGSTAEIAQLRIAFGR